MPAGFAIHPRTRAAATATVEAFRALACRTARVPAVWQPGSFGTGILNVAALLDAALPAANDLRQASAA